MLQGFTNQFDEPESLYEEIIGDDKYKKSKVTKEEMEKLTLKEDLSDFHKTT